MERYRRRGAVFKSTKTLRNQIAIHKFRATRNRRIAAYYNSTTRPALFFLNILGAVASCSMAMYCDEMTCVGARTLAPTVGPPSSWMLRKVAALSQRSSGAQDEVNHLSNGLLINAQTGLDREALASGFLYTAWIKAKPRNSRDLRTHPKLAPAVTRPHPLPK
jgi:hypothetical protein